MSEVTQYCYRYNADVRMDKHGWVTGVQVRLRKYWVLRETACGYWIVPEYMKTKIETLQEREKRWIKKGAKNSFAYRDRQKAWQNFKARKQREKELLKAKACRVQGILSEIQQIEEADRIPVE